MKIEQLKKDQKAFVTDILAKCDEVGDCMIWTGKTTSSGYPKMTVAEGRVLIRRRMAAMKIGRELKRNEVAASTCNDPLCLCWDHIRVITTAQRRAETGAEGGYSSKIKGVRISMSKRQGAKLEGGQTAADSIRMDPRPSHEVAPDHGISPSMVRRIRQGRAWRPLGNPFVGLGARA